VNQTNSASKPIPAISHALAFVAILAVLLIAYSSVIFVKYGYMDDYFWLNLALRHPGEIFPPQATQGRPLNALILRAAFGLIHGIDGLRWVRLLTIVEMTGLAWMFYMAMLRAGWKPLPSALLAMIVCLTPSVQVYIAWATSVPIPWSGMLAAAAALLTGWICDQFKRRYPLLILPAIFLFLSLIVYQPSGMIFWSFAAIDILRRNRERHRFHRADVYLIVSIVGLALGWCVFKWGLSHFPPKYIELKRTHIVIEPAHKLEWFFDSVLVDALNFFRIWPHVWIAMVTGALLLAGLFCYFRKIAHVRLAIALLPMAYVPNLVAPEDWSSYRSQIGLEWLLLFLAWLALNGIWETIRRRPVPILVPALVTLFCMVLAAYHVTIFFARPQATELAAFRLEMSRPEVKSAQEIILLQPGWSATLAPFSRYDEFGRTSLHAGWVPQSEVNLIRGEFDSDAVRIPVTIYPDFYGDWATPLPPGTALIDMRWLNKAK
jgi:hypothetical protein